MQGWIKIHRKLMDNPIYVNANMLKLWIHCLMKATHSEREQLVGNQMVKLEVGEFVTGRNALADEFNKGAKKDEVVSGRTLWRYMKLFEEWQMVSIKSTTKYSVITVINWYEHQQVTNSCPTVVQQLSTNKNVKNEKNKDKEIVVTSVPTVSNIVTYEMVDLENAQLLFGMMRENNPRVREPNLQKWADDFRKMRVRAKHPRTDEEVKFFIHWTQNHEFWHTNILSPAKLDKQFDKLFLVAKRESKAGKPTSSTFDAARERFEREEN